MNTITLTLTTMTLGVMIGVTGTHYHHVNTMVENGVSTPAQPAIQQDEPVYQDVAPPTSPVLLASSDITSAQRPVMPMVVENTSYRDDALLEILASIRNEQRTMRRQMADTNRDLDELSFQVDTHSDSFKPLRTDSARPRPLGGVSQPLDGGIDLLPPKQ